jgi:tetratricopeptide (TPR) repeat protein
VPERERDAARGRNTFRRPPIPLGMSPLFQLGRGGKHQTFMNLLRCADSYVVTYEGARRLLARLLPLAYPFDLQANFLLNTAAVRTAVAAEGTGGERAGAEVEAGAEASSGGGGTLAGATHDSRVYWAEPTLVSQGSQTAQVASTLRDSGVYDAPASAAVRAHAYRQALRLAPGHAHRAHSLYELGAALEAQGKTDEAMDTWRRAVRLQPKHAAAKARLEESSALM